jgi:hypothetical protein
MTERLPELIFLEPSLTEPSLTEPSLTEPSLTEPSLTDLFPLDPSLPELIPLDPSLSESTMQQLQESKHFLGVLKNAFALYNAHGCRSSKKVDEMHNYVKEQVEIIIDKNNKGRYKVQLEKNVPSVNSVGKKKCDIVVYKNENPYIVFPLKFIMSNYKQNRNNSWESLTGEIMHLNWANKYKEGQGLNDFHIVPINIIFNQVPYLLTNKKIKSFESIAFENSFQIMSHLKQRELIYDAINYIIDVEHQSAVGEIYDKCPNFIGVNEKTPFRTFDAILGKLLY